MISCDIISLGQTCNNDFSFSKHLENIRGYDLPDSHALKNQVEGLTEELIEMSQANKKKQNILNRSQKTLNNAENFLEKLCSGNGQHKLCTEITNTYKRNKNNVDLTS